MKKLVLMILAVCTSAAVADDFPKVIDTEPDKSPVMPADQTAASFKVADGFKISVFRRRARHPEPDRDDLGTRRADSGSPRIYTYAERSARFDLRHRDRVLIFEDTDGDGKHDKRTVFTDDVQMLTSVRGRPSAASTCSARRSFSSSPIATETTNPTPRPRWSSMASRSRLRITTTSPMA